MKTRIEKPVYRRSSRQGMCLLPGDLTHSESSQSSDSEVIINSEEKSKSQTFRLLSPDKNSETELNNSTNIIDLEDDEVLEEFIKNYEK